MSAWRWWDFKPEAIELMHEGVYDAEISRRLGVPTYYLRSWRKEAGLPPSKGRPIDKPLYTTEQLNAVIELIHEGNTISEISRKTGVSISRIRQLREEKIREGNPLPEIKVGASRSNQKYSDEKIFDLILQNPGFGVLNFKNKLGIGFRFLTDFLDSWKEVSGEDLESVLNNTLFLDEFEFVEKFGFNPWFEFRNLPRGAPFTSNLGKFPIRIEDTSTKMKTTTVTIRKVSRKMENGERKIRFQFACDDPTFFWNGIENIDKKSNTNVIDEWIDRTLALNGYIDARQHREDFITSTGAGATKFNKWMRKANLSFNKQTGRWTRLEDE